MNQRILFFIVVIAVIAPVNSMYAMNTAKKAFITLQHGAAAASAVWYTKRQYDNYQQEGMRLITQSKPADDKSQKFIEDIIKKNYPELKDRTINIILDENQSFAATKYDGVNYLVVPFNDTQLEQAIEKKATRQKYPTLAHTLRINDHLLNDDETIALLEYRGVAMTGQTLDIWHGNILHECSHISNNDTTVRLAANIAPAYAIIIASNLIKRKLALIPVTIALCQTPLAVARWQEYRADQDAIKRATNPEILIAMGNWFARFPVIPPTNLAEQIQQLRKPHPENATRAAYLTKASQELKIKQAAQKN